MGKQHASNSFLQRCAILLVWVICLGISAQTGTAEDSVPPWRRSLEINPVTSPTLISAAVSTIKGNTPRVDMALTKQPIEMAVSILANASKKTIILGEGERTQQVTAFFKDTPVDEALRSFAQAQQLCLVEQNGTILLVSRQEYLSSYAKTEIVPLKHANPDSLVKLLPQAQAGKSELLIASADPRTRTLILRGDPEQISKFRESCLQLDRAMTGEAFSIRYASVTSVAKEISDALGLSKDSVGSVIADERSNQLIVNETPENIELCRTLIKSIDMQVETRVFSTGNIDPAKIADQIKKGELGGTEKGDKNIKSATKAEATVQVVEGTNQIIVTDTPERLANLEKVMQEINNNIETRVFQPKNSTPMQLADVIKTAFANIVVTTDPRSGSLIVTGQKDRIEQVDKLIQQVDAADNIQVEIDSRIMLVATGKLKAFGLRVYGDYLNGTEESLANATINPNFPADSVKRIGQVMGSPPNAVLKNPVKGTSNYLEVLQPNIQVQAVVKAIENDSGTKLLSNPRLRMLTGESATFFSGTKEPYMETTFQNNQSVENVKYLDVGVNFTVTPNVSPSRMIMLQVSTEFSTLREIRNGNPVVDTRRAESLVQASDGETILVGGLISQQDDTQKAGIPVLRSIPWLGPLFGAKQRNSEKGEMIIVITPKILDQRLTANTSLSSLKTGYSMIQREFPEQAATTSTLEAPPPVPLTIAR